MTGFLLSLCHYCYIAVAGIDLWVFRIVPFSVSLCNLFPHGLYFPLNEMQDRRIGAGFHFVFQLYLFLSACRAGVQWVELVIYFALLYIFWEKLQEVFRKRKLHNSGLG